MNWDWDELAGRDDWRDYILPYRTEEQFWAEGLEQAKMLDEFIERREVVCDVGAGIGRVLRYIDAGRRIAVEPTSAFRERIDLPDCLLLRDVSEVGSETVDFAYCLMVYQHVGFSEQGRLTAELARMLAPGGKALIQIPCGPHYKMNPRQMQEATKLAATYGTFFDDSRVFPGRLAGYETDVEGSQELFILGTQSGA